MKIRYSTTHASQRPSDSLPRLEMTLSSQGKAIGILGLVDSGSTINVLPFQAGLELGFRWDANKAGVRLSGNLALHKAMPVMAMGQVGNFDPIQFRCWLPGLNQTMFLRSLARLISLLSSRFISIGRATSSRFFHEPNRRAPRRDPECDGCTAPLKWIAILSGHADQHPLAMVLLAYTRFAVNAP
jgi:hypothetical protein